MANQFVDTMKAKFEDRSAVVGVIGMGYVGLPMAELAANQGYHVVGIEVDEGRVERINKGDSYILDVPSSKLKALTDQGLIRATTDYAELAKVDVVLITVPTPLGKTGDPDMSFILDAIKFMEPYLHAGMLIALESTTYPGTTEELFVPMAERAGLAVGEELFLSFSPERVDPGNATYGTKNTPKVVGGLTPACTDVSNAYYGSVIDHPVPVSSTTAAEMVKLYENTFRAINIGLVNELAIICNLLKVDVWEIVNAAATKPFGFMPFYPGPGLGGHCIPVDPSYLAWRMRTLQYKTRFIDLATEVNTKMPEWVVTRAMEMLNDEAKALRGAKIMLLGVAYKNDIDDLRESPALDVFDLLVHRGADVSYHDPYCAQMKVEGGVIHSQALTKETLEQQDLVILTTGHKKVDYNLVLDNTSLLFDTRNVTRDMKGKAKVVFL
ncbi:nucleotide sugar dehydrogenase [bacterium]|nr:nucleotide sugar dehydrogenase [bacterium]